MENTTCDGAFKLACVIVNNGQGSKVLSIAKHHGISGGTVLVGRGTIKTRLLDFLDLNDVRKEIVLMIGGSAVIDAMLAHLVGELHLCKPNRGIAFSSDVSGLFGTRSCTGSVAKEMGGAEKTMFNAIYTIVEKGLAEDVIDAATKAGSRGGTIMSARGSGIHETSKLFHMEVEPEKEIVLILSDEAGTEAIVASIQEGLAIDKPGNGIIFVQPLSRTYGLY